MTFIFFKAITVILLNDVIFKKRLMLLIEIENKFLENLEYQIGLKERSYKSFKKIPVFAEQLKQLDESVINLKGKFDKIRLRDKYHVIITELEDLIKESKKK